MSKFALEQKNSLNKLIVICVIILIALPNLLYFLGLNISHTLFNTNNIDIINLNQIQINKLIYNSLFGKFISIIWDWSNFFITCLILLLTFIHYKIEKNIIIPIIGVALFLAALVDTAHTLAINHIISLPNHSDHSNPSSWTLGQLYYTIIFYFAFIIINKYYERIIQGYNKKLNKRIILESGLLFSIVTAATLTACSASNLLPADLLTNSFIAKPYQLIVIFIWVTLLISVIWPFYKKDKSIFIFTIVLSTVLQICSQCNMTFGSQINFDTQYQIAFFLKTIAKVLPFIGLLIDYSLTYKNATTVYNTLIKATNQLKKSNKELAQFAYAASHDLQTPLRHISNYTELLHQKNEKKVTPTQEELKWVNHIVTGTNRMKNLISDLLAYSYSSKMIAKDIKPIKLNKIIEYTITSLEDKAKSLNAKFIVNALPVINCNGTKIAQLFQNLIENSLKFGKPNINNLIEIGSSRQLNDTTMFWVKDSGQGIKESAKSKVFGVFQKFHNSDNQNGNGIGLAICKQIVELHGGKIWLESQENKGTTVYFTLKNSTIL